MTHKLCLYIFFVFLFVKTYAQNNQILYGFDQLPQTLMLNPGAEVNYNKHIGVPFLSNIFFQVGATNKNINYNNVLADADNQSDRLRNVYEQNLSSNDYLMINQRLEVLNAGFRLKNPKFYLSFGMYEEIDGFGLYPEEFAELFFEGDDKNGDGIPELNEKTNFNEINFIGEFIGVFHVGISNQVNEKLNIGARLKIISGSVNMNSTSNNGSYSLSASPDGFHHNFDDLNVVLNTSGFIDPYGGDVFGDLSDNFGGLFFGHGNFGLGLDLGATYHVNDEITLTASVLDIDYVSYSNEVTSYIFANDFVLNDGTYFDPPEGNELNYWKDILTDYYNEEQIPIDTIQAGYNSYRSPKINTSAKYTFYHGGKTDESVFRNVKCYKCLTTDAILTSEVGIQTYTVFRPNKIGWAITGYYSREFNKYINAKITYTYDDFSPYNIGLGLSTHYKKINFYVTADNLLNLPKLKDSNYQSFQFGMNFIFQ